MEVTSRVDGFYAGEQGPFTTVREAFHVACEAAGWGHKPESPKFAHYDRRPPTRYSKSSHCSPEVMAK